MKISKYRIMQIINESYQSLVKESFTARELKNKIRSMVFNKSEEELKFAASIMESYAMSGIKEKQSCLRVLTGFIEDLRKIIESKRKSLVKFRERINVSDSFFAGAREYSNERELTSRAIELRDLIKKREYLIKTKKQIEDL